MGDENGSWVTEEPTEGSWALVQESKGLGPLRGWPSMRVDLVGWCEQDTVQAGRRWEVGGPGVPTEDQGRLLSKQNVGIGMGV